MSGSFTFGGVTAESLGLRVGGVNTYGASGRSVQTYYVPGRIGAVYPQKDLSQIPNEIREYSTALYLQNATPEQVERAMAAIRAAVMTEGYSELRDSYEPDVYRRAYFDGDYLTDRKGAGENFEIPIRFSCDPRRFIVTEMHYIINGIGQISTPSSVNGFTITEAAKPLLLISNGDQNTIITFSDTASGATIGTITVQGEADFFFDAESLDAYTEGDPTVSANQYVQDVSGEIRIGPSSTTISIDTSQAAVTIYPRWWVR